MQSITRARERQELSRLAEAQSKRLRVDAHREQLHWDMGQSGDAANTSAMMGALVAGRANRLSQSFQVDALLREAQVQQDAAQQNWSDAAQKAAAIDKLHEKFLAAQRLKLLKSERDEAQEVAQMKWLKDRRAA